MTRLISHALAGLALLCSAPALADAELKPAVKADYDKYLRPLFVHFHRYPELSYVENETAKRMAAELRKAGAEVTTGVGGTGVVGVMRNGAGPALLVRADMDGLPVKETSGLAYASTVTQKGRRRSRSPVMHACGHDMHITVAGRHRAAARGDEGPLAGHDGVCRPAGGGTRSAAPGDDQGRALHPLSQARICARLPCRCGSRRRADRGRARHCFTRPSDRVDIIVHGSRRARRLAASGQGPDRHGRRDRHGAADPGQPRDLAAVARRRDGRRIPFGLQAQHHFRPCGFAADGTLQRRGSPRRCCSPASSASRPRSARIERHAGRQAAGP